MGIGDKIAKNVQRLENKVKTGTNVLKNKHWRETDRQLDIQRR